MDKDHRLEKPLSLTDLEIQQSVVVLILYGIHLLSSFFLLSLMSGLSNLEFSTILIYLERFEEIFPDVFLEDSKSGSTIIQHDVIVMETITILLIMISLLVMVVHYQNLDGNEIGRHPRSASRIFFFIDVIYIYFIMNAVLMLLYNTLIQILAVGWAQSNEVFVGMATFSFTSTIPSLISTMFFILGLRLLIHLFVYAILLRTNTDDNNRQDEDNEKEVPATWGLILAAKPLKWMKILVLISFSYMMIPFVAMVFISLTIPGFFGITTGISITLAALVTLPAMIILILFMKEELQSSKQQIVDRIYQGFTIFITGILAYLTYSNPLPDINSQVLSIQPDIFVDILMLIFILWILPRNVLTSKFGIRKLLGVFLIIVLLVSTLLGGMIFVNMQSSFHRDITERPQQQFEYEFASGAISNDTIEGILTQIIVILDKPNYEEESYMGMWIDIDYLIHIELIGNDYQIEQCYEIRDITVDDGEVETRVDDNFTSFEIQSSTYVASLTILTNATLPAGDYILGIRHHQTENCEPQTIPPQLSIID